MTSLFRLRWVAVCLLSACLGGPSVSAQFLNQDIITANPVTEPMKGEMLKLVTPMMGALTAAQPDAKSVSDARDTLINPLTNIDASAAFKQAFSDMIRQKLKPAVEHESVMVRINAMILLGHMTDDKSLAMIDAGLKDENVAVQRKAMEALQRRVQRWLGERANAKVQAAFDQVVKLLDQRPAPHPIVVAPALEILLNINSADSHDALVDQLNKRVALHAADPNLTYHGERSALDTLGRWLPTANPFPEKLATGVNRAAYRFALVIAGQLKAGKIDEEHREGAVIMLAQSLQTMGNISARGGKAAPQGAAQIKSWIQDAAWGEIESMLINDWPPLLKQKPFSLTDQELAVPVN